MAAEPGDGSPEIVKGEIVLDSPLSSVAADVTVQLRDTTLADGPATVVAEVRFSVSDRDATPIPFSLAVPAGLDPRRRYTLGATVTAPGGDGLGAGDFVNVESVPWAPGGDAVRLPVRRI